MSDVYKIVRFYANPYKPNRTVKVGLTLEEAQEYCKDPETSSTTCKKPENKARTNLYGGWFCGYTVQK